MLSFLLFQIHTIELLNFVERNLFEVVIQVGVACSGDNQQFFVAAFQHLVRVFTEIA